MTPGFVNSIFSNIIGKASYGTKGGVCMSNVPHSGTGHVSAKPWDYFRGFSKPERRMRGAWKKGKHHFPVNAGMAAS